MPLEVSITNEQKVRIKAMPLTAAGNPAPIDGALTAMVVSGEATWEADPADNLALYLISASTPGDTTYLIEADADIGDGIVTIQDTVTLRVASALAANLGIMAEPPVPK